MSTKNIAVNPKYLNKEFLQQFLANYSHAMKNWSSDGCCLFSDPFPFASFDEFMQPAKPEHGIKNSQELVCAIEAEVHRLSFKHNENDLFSFNQSVDISTLHSATDFRLLKEFRSFMLSEVLPWMKIITGAPLDSSKIDLTASIYKQTDFLLCHDDELEGRRIAFIWYLVPEDWDAKMDGGCLQLFDCKKTSNGASEQTILDEPCAPWNASTTLPPKRNMLAFFEVSDLSYHQVTEILGDKARVSLHGWFHGPPLRTQPAITKSVSPPSLLSPVSIEEELLYSWLNPIYLDMDEQARIRRRFKRTSEIQLAHFLKAEKWVALSRQLAQYPESSWCLCGPMNQKHHGVLTNAAQEDAAGPEILRQLHRLFSSEAMQVILSDLTGVELHPISSSETLTRRRKVVCSRDDTMIQIFDDFCKDAKSLADNEPPPLKRAHIEAGTDSGPPSEHEPGKLSAPQLRRWQPGNYTLLADTDVGSGSKWRLETVLHITGYGGQSGKGDQARNWQPTWGGQLIYIASGEKDELLTVHPKDNCLTLVYTGPGTASFVKYINHAAVPRPPPSSSSSADTGELEVAAAFDLSVVFYEPDGTDHDDASDGDSETVSDAITDDDDEEEIETESERSVDSSRE